MPRAVCVQMERCEPSVPLVCPGCALAAFHGTKTPHQGGWWRWGRFVLLLVWHGQPFTSPFCSEMSGENPVALLWLGSTVPTSPVPLQDSVPGLPPRRGTPRKHPGALGTPGITSAARSIPSVAAGSAPQLFPGRCSARGPARAPFEETANPIICSFLSQREISEHSPAAECGLPPASPALPPLPCAQGRGGGVSRSPRMRPEIRRSGTLQKGDPTKRGPYKPPAARCEGFGVQESRVWG